MSMGQSSTPGFVADDLMNGDMARRRKLPSEVERDLAISILANARSGGTQPMIITHACSRQDQRIMSEALYSTSLAVGSAC